MSNRGIIKSNVTTNVATSTANDATSDANDATNPLAKNKRYNWR